MAHSFNTASAKWLRNHIVECVRSAKGISVARRLLQVVEVQRTTKRGCVLWLSDTHHFIEAYLDPACEKKLLDGDDSEFDSLEELKGGNVTLYAGTLHSCVHLDLGAHQRIAAGPPLASPGPVPPRMRWEPDLCLHITDMRYSGGCGNGIIGTPQQIGFDTEVFALLKQLGRIGLRPFAPRLDAADRHHSHLSTLAWQQAAGGGAAAIGIQDWYTRSPADMYIPLHLQARLNEQIARCTQQYYGSHTVPSAGCSSNSSAGAGAANVSGGGSTHPPSSSMSGHFSSHSHMLTSGSASAGSTPHGSQQHQHQHGFAAWSTSAQAAPPSPRRQNHHYHHQQYNAMPPQPLRPPPSPDLVIPKEPVIFTPDKPDSDTDMGGGDGAAAAGAGSAVGGGGTGGFILTLGPTQSSTPPSTASSSSSAPSSQASSVHTSQQHHHQQEATVVKRSLIADVKAKFLRRRQEQLDRERAEEEAAKAAAAGGGMAAAAPIATETSAATRVEPAAAPSPPVLASGLVFEPSTSGTGVPGLSAAAAVDAVPLDAATALDLQPAPAPLRVDDEDLDMDGGGDDDVRRSLAAAEAALKGAIEELDGLQAQAGSDSAAVDRVIDAGAAQVDPEGHDAAAAANPSSRASVSSRTIGGTGADDAAHMHAAPSLPNAGPAAAAAAEAGAGAAEGVHAERICIIGEDIGSGAARGGVTSASAATISSSASQQLTSAPAAVADDAPHNGEAAATEGGDGSSSELPATEAEDEHRTSSSRDGGSTKEAITTAATAEESGNGGKEVDAAVADDRSHHEAAAVASACDTDTQPDVFLGGQLQRAASGPSGGSRIASRSGSPFNSTGEGDEQKEEQQPMEQVAAILSQHSQQQTHDEGDQDAPLSQPPHGAEPAPTTGSQLGDYMPVDAGAEEEKVNTEQTAGGSSGYLAGSSQQSLASSSPSSSPSKIDEGAALPYRRSRSAVVDDMFVVATPTSIPPAQGSPGGSTDGNSGVDEAAKEQHQMEVVVSLTDGPGGADIDDVAKDEGHGFALASTSAALAASSSSSLPYSAPPPSPAHPHRHSEVMGVGSKRARDTNDAAAAGPDHGVGADEVPSPAHSTASTASSSRTCALSEATMQELLREMNRIAEQQGAVKRRRKAAQGGAVGGGGAKKPKCRPGYMAFADKAPRRSGGDDSEDDDDQ